MNTICRIQTLRDEELSMVAGGYMAVVSGCGGPVYRAPVKERCHVSILEILIAIFGGCHVMTRAAAN